VESLHITAPIEEVRGHREEADDLFENTQRLVQRKGFVALAHTIAFAYGNVVSAGSDHQKAIAQYQLAAEMPWY
jgi:hypothetical protein